MQACLEAAESSEKRGLDCDVDDVICVCLESLRRWKCRSVSAYRERNEKEGRDDYNSRHTRNPT